MISSLLSLLIASSITTNNDIFNEIDLVINTNQEISKIEKNNLMISPIITARNAIVIDMESGAVLYEKNSNDQVPIASITKLMTNYIIVQENNLDEIVKISTKAANEPGSTMGLFSGEAISVRNLIYGSLMNSGNDASTALAEYNAGSVSAFVDKMNQKVDELGLYNTHYQNAHGIDQNNHYSSAMDVAKIAQEIYKNEFIQEVVQTKTIIVTSETGKTKHNLRSTNDLLDSYLNIKGLKTGTTPLAGECLTAIAELENKKQLLTVVLGSSNRFKDSKILIDWTEKAYYKN